MDVPTAAATVANFQRIMMERFKFMENEQVNNIYKIKDKEVDYYEWAGQKYQFDEMFELLVDLDENDRNYSKMKAIYQDGRQPMIITIKEIYDGMMEDKWKGRHPQMPVVKGYNSYIDKDSIRKSKGIFTPKILLFLADELNELMTSDDYKSVDTVKQSLGSIARLGRAAAVHLALACQRASGSTISADLKNNIQMSCLLGGFDDGASQLMFEKDISNLCKPEIKGRGFIGSGNEIIETQTYYTQPEKDWEFDDQQLITYNNPVFHEQCKLRGIKPDDSGFIPQKPLDEVDENDDKDIDEVDENDDDDFAPKSIPIKRGRPEKPSERPSMRKPDAPPPMSKPLSKPSDTESKAEEPKKQVNKDSLMDILGKMDKKESSVIETPSIKEEPPKVEASIRDKLNEGTSDIPKPKIKLNVDKSQNNNSKIKLKFNNKKEE